MRNEETLNIMKREIIFKMESPYRGTFNIEGFRFGEGEKTVAIVGAMRGDEIQQQYICARLVAKLTELEQRGCIEEGKSILVIPSCNPFSMNVSKRFWAMDGTDINRMFPGYDKGETTQRIAAALFEHIKDFKYGLQLASFYMSGDFVPHVRMLTTGYEDVKTACLFGLPFVTKRKPLPFDTTLLNYNWQIWDTQAFSLYAGTTEVIDPQAAETSLQAVCRFLAAKGMVHLPCREELPPSSVLSESDMLDIKAPRAGLLMMHCAPGQRVKRGEHLASILHPYEGHEQCRITSPADATVFFLRHKSICFQQTLLFRLIAVQDE